MAKRGTFFRLAERRAHGPGIIRTVAETGGDQSPARTYSHHQSVEPGPTAIERLEPHLEGAAAPAVRDDFLCSFPGGWLAINPVEGTDLGAFQQQVQTEIITGLPGVFGFTLRRSLFGGFEDTNSVELRLSAASEVEGVPVEVAPVGPAVAAGDVIARVDPRLLALAVRRAEAAVAIPRDDGSDVGAARANAAISARGRRRQVLLADYGPGAITWNMSAVTFHTPRSFFHTTR